MTTRESLGQDRVTVPAGAVKLEAKIVLPDHPHGIVLFVDEVATRQLASKYQELTNALTNAGIGSMLMELLTSEEQANPQTAAYLRSDIQQLAARVVGASDWLADAPRTSSLPIGYFGTGIGGAVAMAAAAERPAIIDAIVLSSGRPLLVPPALPQVRAPTLLITDARREALVRLNRAALRQLLCEKRLEILSQTGTESERMHEVERLTRHWFDDHFRVAGTSLR